MNRVAKIGIPLPRGYELIIRGLLERSWTDVERIHILHIGEQVGVNVLQKLLPSFKAPTDKPGDLYEANPDSPIQQCLDYGSLCAIQHHWKTLPGELKEKFSKKVVLAWKTTCRTESGLTVPALNCLRRDEDPVIVWIDKLTAPFPEGDYHGLEI